MPQPRFDHRAVEVSTSRVTEAHILGEHSITRTRATTTLIARVHKVPTSRMQFSKAASCNYWPETPNHIQFTRHMCWGELYTASHPGSVPAVLRRVDPEDTPLHGLAVVAVFGVVTARREALALFLRTK